MSARHFLSLMDCTPDELVGLIRRGMELKEAFNQVNRYQRHSYWSDHGLFQYVQLFVISNGVNTKYYANNRDQDFNQTFFWADIENKLITQLDAFADAFQQAILSNHGPQQTALVIAKEYLLYPVPA